MTEATSAGCGAARMCLGDRVFEYALIQGPRPETESCLDSYALLTNFVPLVTVCTGRIPTIHSSILQLYICILYLQVTGRQKVHVTENLGNRESS